MDVVIVFILIVTVKNNIVLNAPMFQIKNYVNFNLF